ncbi:MAG: S-layer homology domain-containing protein [Bryobacterales bacterium]|nr:S-layer homology domain-containing protein [Bryobacterales bacterium]
MFLGSGFARLAFILAIAAPLNAQETLSLLKPAEEGPARAARPLPTPPGVKVHRQRLVEVNRDALLSPSEQARRITIEVFAGTSFTVDESRAWWSKDQSTFLWTGTIAGMQRGHAAIAITGEIVSANFTTDSDEFYSLRQVEGALHVIQQVEVDTPLEDPDDGVLPDAAEIASVEKQHTPERLATANRGAPATVDVLVVYTPAARSAAGGTSSILNKINLAIAELNQSFANSSVATTVQLAAAVEVVYTEDASISDDLDNLRATNDGPLDDVHALRNQYGADLVALLIHRGTGSIAGQAFIMQAPGPSFAGWGFSVTEQAYAAGPNYTLSHELGHNFGSAHDRANSGSGGAYSYSYGYQGPTFRSIMAYSCSDRSCPRINYWSNPSVNYLGVPTGIAGNLSNSADNAQSLNNTASIVAAFRAAATGCSYSLGSSSYSAASAGASSTFSVTAGSGCNWTASSNNAWITVTSGSSGSGNGTVFFTVQPNTGALRTGTITAAGLTFTITQNAGVCTYTLNPTSASFSSASETGSVSVTAGTGCTWTASSANSWIQVTAGQSGSGNGTVAYLVHANTGAARNGSITIAGQSFPISQSAATGISVTVTSIPSGLALQVDGSTIATPQTFSWTPGSTHTISASTQGAGTRYAFLSWSDSGASTHTVTAPSAPATYTATFQTQYLLTRTAAPANGGSIVVSPNTADGYYSSGMTVTATATPSPGFTFSNWSGALSTISNPVNIAIDGQKTIMANFVSQAGITVTSNPSGRTVVVDGTQYTAPAVFQWTTGTIHTIEAPSPQQAANVQYTFAGWSDGGSPTHSITAGAGTSTYTANFNTTALCSFALSQTSANVLATGDLRQINLSTTAGCPWTATSNAAWITILTGVSGNGGGSIRFTIAENTAATPRTGTLTIAGLTFTVTQSAASCSYTLTGPLTAVLAGASNFSVTISTSAGCQWGSYAYPSFLNATPASGAGSGTINVTVSANPNIAARLGVVTVGGQHLQVLQQGSLTSPLFTDVPSNYLFLDYINLLKLNSISPGCNAGGYCPEEPMLRTEMAAFIIRALFGESFSYTLTPYFTDVAATHPYFRYIQKMRDQGITIGCTETTYCPNGQVSRGQMAAFLIRARLSVTQGTPFPHASGAYFNDVNSSHVFFPFVQKMKESGITSGCTATNYCPDNPVTRGQMSVFVNRAFLY